MNQTNNQGVMKRYCMYAHDLKQMQCIITMKPSTFPSFFLPCHQIPRTRVDDHNTKVPLLV